jgi:hypothetical protein
MDDSTNEICFPYDLPPKMVAELKNLTAEQWIQHCRNVQKADAGANEPEVIEFLSQLFEVIVQTF